MDKEFICPITQELMVSPVVAADGFSYEESAITRWFATGKTRSPVSNELLTNTNVVPNHTVRRMILAYRRDQGAKLLACCKEGMYLRAEFVRVVGDLVDGGGADVNIRDKNGNTPLMILLLRGKEDFAEVLMDHGAKVTAVNDEGLDVLQLAKRQNCHPEFISKVEQVIEQEVVQKEEEERIRQEQQDAYRQQQEQRRRQMQNESSEFTSPWQSASLMNSELNGEVLNRNGLVVRNPMGFFPSLFGLQFINITDRSALIPEHDQEQHKFLTRVLFGLTFLVFLVTSFLL